MLVKELLTSLELLRKTAERPEAQQAIVKKVSEPEAQPVTHHRPGYRPGHRGPEVQVTQGNQRAKADHHQGARYQDTDNHQRFRHRHRKDQQAGQ